MHRLKTLKFPAQQAEAGKFFRTRSGSVVSPRDSVAIPLETRFSTMLRELYVHRTFLLMVRDAVLSEALGVSSSPSPMHRPANGSPTSSMARRIPPCPAEPITADGTKELGRAEIASYLLDLDGDWREIIEH